MVLIMPEMRSHARSRAGLTTAGLQASIRNILESGEQGDLSRLHVRILGSYVIIEGLVESEDSIPEIVALAEGVAGAGNVRLRVFCH